MKRNWTMLVLLAVVVAMLLPGCRTGPEASKQVAPGARVYHIDQHVEAKGRGTTGTFVIY